MVRSEFWVCEENLVMDVVCHDGTQYVSADIFEGGDIIVCDGRWVRFIVDDYVVLMPSSNIKECILREEKAE